MRYQIEIEANGAIVKIVTKRYPGVGRVRLEGDRHRLEGDGDELWEVLALIAFYSESRGDQYPTLINGTKFIPSPIRGS